MQFWNYDLIAAFEACLDFGVVAAAGHSGQAQILGVLPASPRLLGWAAGSSKEEAPRSEGVTFRGLSLLPYAPPALTGSDLRVRPQWGAVITRPPSQPPSTPYLLQWSRLSSSARWRKTEPAAANRSAPDLEYLRAPPHFLSESHLLLPHFPACLANSYITFSPNQIFAFLPMHTPLLPPCSMLLRNPILQLGSPTGANCCCLPCSPTFGWDQVPSIPGSLEPEATFRCVGSRMTTRREFQAGPQPTWHQEAKGPRADTSHECRTRGQKLLPQRLSDLHFWDSEFWLRPPKSWARLPCTLTRSFCPMDDQLGTTFSSEVP